VNLYPITYRPKFIRTALAGTGNDTVEIWSPSDEDAIYYTVDGSAPTTDSTRYVSVITVGAAVTVRAVAKAKYRLLSRVGRSVPIVEVAPEPPLSPLLLALDDGTVLTLDTIESLYLEA
jgi:hypothetical protein